MNALIENMLDLARGRLGGGLTLVRDANAPLGPVLQAVITEVRASHPDQLVQAELALVEPVNCDRGRIAQLLSNLLSNALIYGSAEEPVRVLAKNDMETFELSVSNAGNPIPLEVVPHLFEPFYRGSSLHARQGLGLGLYIAGEIAKAHGGRLSVVSTQEETRFVFRMPVV
jgi:sigma-B regulation protein RsbU (phosphoserine phosphatase)